MAVVYVAVNLINDKIYVGATEKELRERQWKHICNANRGQKSKFYTAIRKYGKESFKFLVIHQCADFFEALDYERIYIAKLKPEYNMTDGGGGVKGLSFSAESREKMSAAKRGKIVSWMLSDRADEIWEKVKRRQSETRRGKKITNPARLATMRKMIESGNEARRRSVVCLNTGKIFDSVTEAAKMCEVTTGSIVLYCRGKKSRKGYRFAYLDEVGAA